MDSSLTDFLCYQISGRAGDFCARVLASLEPRASNTIPMMGVTVRDRHYVLLYNPAWIARAQYDDVVATTWHEVYHIIFEHIPRHFDMERQFQHDEKLLKLFHRVTPLAADMAVNTLLIDANDFIRKHPDEWVLPRHGMFTTLPARQTYEFYVRELMKLMPKDSDVQHEAHRLLQHSGFNSAKSQNHEMFPSGNGNGAVKVDPDADALSTSSPGDIDHADNKSTKTATGQDQKQGQTENPELGIGKQLLVNHKDWNDVNLNQSSEDKANLSDELRQQGKFIVKQAVEAHQKSCGHIPAGLSMLIEKLLRQPQIPWRRVFRNIVAKERSSHRQRSLSRPRRRFLCNPNIIPFPGRKRDRTYHVAFLIDTSASMCKEELAMALNELEGMIKMDKQMMVTVIEADAAVEREYRLDDTRHDVKYDPEGGGGTNFNPALKRAQELRPHCDAVFYFTDGGAAAPRKASRVPCTFHWIITPFGKHPDPDGWGKAIFTKAD